MNAWMCSITSCSQTWRCSVMVAFLQSADLSVLRPHASTMPMRVTLGLSLEQEQVGTTVSEETSEQVRANLPSWLNQHLASDVKLV